MLFIALKWLKTSIEGDQSENLIQRGWTSILCQIDVDLMSVRKKNVVYRIITQENCARLANKIKHKFMFLAKLFDTC